jgi:hypothetical protein
MHCEILADGAGMCADVPESELLQGEIVAMGRIPGVTSSGRSAVAIKVQLTDGRFVLARTTLRLFQSAAGAFLAFDLRENPGVGPLMPPQGLSFLPCLRCDRQKPPAEGQTFPAGTPTCPLCNFPYEKSA